VFGEAIDLSALPIGKIIIVLSLAAMLVASLIAVFETDLKRMLAYSSVAQIGYITLGIGLANHQGLTGGLVHVVNHGLMKATLFLGVGAIFYRIGSVQIKDLAGIGRRMPLTVGAFTVAGFALIGTPGTVGFVSKWHLALGAIDRGSWLLVFLIIGSSIIAMVYLGRVLEIAWMREPTPQNASADDLPLGMLLPILILAAATVYFGIDTEWTAGVAGAAARALLGGAA
jgi:multicomponent Na+:H+ antiporter subunit D